MKKILALVLALVMTLTLLPVTAMAADHVHVWSDGWITKEGIHWHECTASGCDLKSDIYGNDYNVLYIDDGGGYGKCDYDNNGICKQCKVPKPTHVHQWADMPTARTNREHWRVCTLDPCPLEDDTTTPKKITNALHYQYEPHTFDENGRCAGCNWAINHTHSYDHSVLRYNKTHHAPVCTASNCWINDENLAFNEFSTPHTLDRATGKCTGCAYQAHEYTVTFHSNNGASLTTVQDFFYGVEQTLAPNAFTKEGYTFLGWATATDCPEVYTDEQLVSNLTATANANVNLFAVWEANEYTVEFNSNGGNGTMTDQNFVYDVEQALTENAFTKTSHTFLGWAETENGVVKYADKQSVGNLTAGAGEKVVLYAVWTPNQFSYYPTYDPAPETEKVEPAKTADPIGLYLGVTVLATVGSAWLAKKKED